MTDQEASSYADTEESANTQRVIELVSAIPAD